MKASFNISWVGQRVEKPKPSSAHARRGPRFALLSAVLLITAVSMQAQTVTALYSFCPPPDNDCAAGPDGADPESSLTPDGAGGFYGTTYQGGLLYGTVFRLSRNSSGGWNETVIYKFTGGAARSIPWFSNVILDKSGNLYGTLAWGGNEGDGGDGYGVVFQLSRLAGVWTENVLYRFLGGTDGANPVNGLVMDEAGNLYGKTMNGGTGGNGTIFEVSPSGSAWTERVIYNLDAGYGGLAIDRSGNIFSTSSTTVFELSKNGHGGWTPKVLHTFTDAQDGSFPAATPVLHAGSLYGTTVLGGSAGQGTVYRLVPQANGKPKEEILYSFPGGSSGAQPWVGVVFDPAGNLYGTTLLGPESGLVYELVAPVGTGSYTEKILGALSEVGGSNGLFSYGTLIRDTAGNLYGTTGGGGSNGAGTVFEVTP